ncbi:HEAT repeat domain-containing protein [Geobacter sp. AOG2]|uniref:HEAT repeat domain-containing protein n=1 Tax=Geobacter sp. AOG2 TaxID=1566347 RepID=UPI001CC6EAC6|nr:HEAT repeat domain-containing protein [Geobacter sp. AOG2]GFE62058.1 PBS lyase [Geobacter sp. AOG2]
MQVTNPSSPPTVLEALGNVSRALRAWQFYPKGHPSRKNSILQAHQTLLRALDGTTLSLLCGRTGFSLPNGETFKDSMRIAASLSFELFARRAQKITFLGDLFQEDLLDFIRVISLSPDAVQQAGGLEKVMQEHGIRTIWANELDLSTILDKRREVESRGVTPPGLDEIEDDGLEFLDTQESSVPPPENIDPEQALRGLLNRLSTTADEDIYPMLARQGITCCEALIARHEPAPVLPVVELFAQHASDPSRGNKIMEVARVGLEQLAAREEFLEFILDSLSAPDGVSPKGALAVMTTGGQPAVGRAVEKLATTENLAVRKKLTMLLARLGEPAVAPILSMLDDNRWYMVRNLAAILGDIGSRKAVPQLEKCLRHSDTRVAKEAIRSLAKIGGQQAETAVIAVLDGTDSALWPQAIASLGGMKSRKALAVLLQIVCDNDRFLQNLALKCDALTAIAMIGGQQATPRLVKLLESRHIISRSRWTQLKISIAACLAKLDDSRALPALRRKARGSGELARACTEALNSIERTKD